MIRCPGCSYLVPQTWDTCRRCGTLIRAQAPVVAAAAPAPVPVAVPARPPLPPLRHAGSVSGGITPGPPMGAAPPLAPLPPPTPAAAAPSRPVLDEFLPVSVEPEAPARARDTEDLLPVAPPAPTNGKGKAGTNGAARVGPRAKAERPRIDSKLLLLGGGVLALIVIVVGVWMVTKDDVKKMQQAPVDAVHQAEEIAGQSRLNTAATAAAAVYADQGSFANVTPQVLRATEPSIVWLPAAQAAAPGQVSVRVVDGDTLVLVTALPNRSCQGMYQARGGTMQIQVTAPCSAARAQLPNAGG